MPTTLLQSIETKRKKTQRIENKLTPPKKETTQNRNTDLENLTEHGKRHNENRKKDDKYRITSPRASGGGAFSGSKFASGRLGGILRFPGLVVKQVKLARERVGGGG